MKFLDDFFLDYIKVDYERSLFLNGSEVDFEDFVDLFFFLMIDSKGDFYLEYVDEDRILIFFLFFGVLFFLFLRVVMFDNGIMILL